MSTMMVLQPLIGAVLAAWWLRAPFLFYLTAVILAGVLVIRRGWIPDTPLSGVSRSWPPLSRLRPVLVATIALNAFVFGWMLYLSPLLLAERFSYGVAVRGAVLATQSVGSAFAALGARRSVAAGRESGVLIIAAAGVALASLTGATAGTPSIAVLGLVAGGASYGFANPPVLSIASRGREGATGWWQSSARAGQIAGPLTAAGLLSALPMSMAFRLGLVPAAVLLWIGWTGLRRPLTQLGVRGRGEPLTDRRQAD